MIDDPTLPAIATGLPPGWIELVAFRTPERLAGFLRSQIAVDADRFDDDQVEQVLDACLRAHALASRQKWLHLGCVVTELPIHDSSRPTVWTVGVGLLHPPTFGDVNPVVVASRVLGTLGSVDQVVEFTTDDGRDGVVVGGTASASRSGLAAGETSRLLPQMDPERLGMYAVLMPLVGLPDRLVLVVGIAPCVEERQAMSVLAGQMAASVHAVGSSLDYPAHQVLIDTSGTVHPGGFLDPAGDAQPRPVTGGSRA